jgi:hypothetical protein
MTRHMGSDIKRESLGDMAVDGLLGGLGGGAAMALYLVLVSLIGGQGAVALLDRFVLSGGTPLMLLMLQLALAAVYGIVFAMLWWLIVGRIRLPLLGSAVGYGFVLWLIVMLWVLPREGTPLEFGAVLHILIAHLLYGLLLGIALRRFSQTTS